MYTVKKFQPGQTIMRIELSENKAIEFRAPNRITWVVFGADDKPVFKTNLYTQKKEMESYPGKNVALDVADYYNRKATN